MGDLQLVMYFFFSFDALPKPHHLYPNKAPGPDGFTGLFYKVAWPIIKHDVVNAFKFFGPLMVAASIWSTRPSWSSSRRKARLRRSKTTIQLVLCTALVSLWPSVLPGGWHWYLMSRCIPPRVHLFRVTLSTTTSARYTSLARRCTPARKAASC